jgi:hypothetical protein
VRTTITFDPDVAAAVEQARHERGGGISEVVNDLIRAGLQRRRRGRKFRQRSTHLGLQIDVTDVADALEVLEGPTAR